MVLRRCCAGLALAMLVALTVASASSGHRFASGVSYPALMKDARSVIPAHFAGPTTPAKAPKGIKLAVISCWQVLDGCVELAAGAAGAAKAIGWQERTFDGQGSSQVQNTQITNAVSWGAKVIVLIAIDPKTVQTGLAAAKKAGALIFGTDNAGNSPNPLIKAPAGDVWPIADVSMDYGKLAVQQAKWVIADSKGKANILVYEDKEYPADIVMNKALLKTFAKYCPTCKVSPTQHFVASDIAKTVGPNLVSWLRNNPNVNYVYAPYDPSVPSMVTAIQNAGMTTRVKIISFLGNQQNLKYILANQVQYADGAQENTYNGWAVVDQAIRALDHKPLFQPYGENVPIVVLDKTNIGNAANQKAGWTAPYNYKAAYLKLWK